MAEPTEVKINISQALEFAEDVRSSTPPLESVRETADAVIEAMKLAEKHGTLPQISINIPEEAFLAFDRTSLRWSVNAAWPSRSIGETPEEIFYNRPIGQTGLYLQVQEPRGRDVDRLYKPNSGKIIGKDHLTGMRINAGIQTQGRSLNLEPKHS